MSLRQPIPAQYDEYIAFENSKGWNDRFSYAKVRIGDEWFFRKHAKRPELQANLIRESIWARFIKHIHANNHDSNIDAPVVVGFDTEGALLTQYIDAPLVAEPKTHKNWIANLDRYADMLAVLDMNAHTFEYSWPSSDGLASIYRVDVVFDTWLGESSDDIPQLEQAKQFIKESIPKLDFCVQHGDLSPWQIFNADNTWIIFDGEKSGIHLPRFNDLAYAYGRLATRFCDRSAANKLVELFLQKSDIDQRDFEKQFIPIMTFRAVGMIADTLATNDQDQIKAARQLLDNCLKKDLSFFLNNT